MSYCSSYSSNICMLFIHVVNSQFLALIVVDVKFPDKSFIQEHSQHFKNHQLHASTVMSTFSAKTELKLKNSQYDSNKHHNVRNFFINN